MNTIKAVVFDLGGVLIGWNPLNVYLKAFDYDRSKAEWFLNNICTQSWNVKQDAGRSLKEATQIKIDEFPAYQKLIRLYYDQWENMLSGPIDGTVEILRQLKESNQYRICGISNWSAETFPVALRKYEFLRLFEGIVVSGEVKMIKPFEDIYLHAFKKFNIEPQSAVFIDDNAENIETANRLGMKGILFQSPNLLKHELHKLGIETD